MKKSDKQNKNLFVKLLKNKNSKKVKNAPKDLSENYKNYLY